MTMGIKQLVDKLLWVRARMKALEEIETRLREMRFLAETAALYDLSASDREEINEKLAALSAQVDRLDASTSLTTPKNTTLH